MEQGITTLPASLTAAFAVALAATLVLPLTVLAVLAWKRKLSAKPFLLGAASFFVSQIMLRVPLLGLLQTQGWFVAFSISHTLLYLLLVGGMSAGLFEESGRLCGALLLRRRYTYKDVLSFGLGHGLCELVLLIGMGQLNNFMVVMLINSGNTAALEAQLGANWPAFLAQFAAASAAEVYLGLVERVSALLFHMFNTVLVFKGVQARKPWYYLLAVLLHGAFNFVGVWLGQAAGLWAAEAFLLAVGLCGGAYVLRSKNSFSPQQP